MALPQSGKRSLAMRRILVAAVIVSLVAAVWAFTRAKPIPVVLVKVARGAVEATVNNTRAGTIKACRRAKMSAPAGGQISQLKVKKGERVRKGRILLELWNNDLQAQEHLAKDELGTAQITAHQTCTQADLSEREAERARQLREKGFISAEGLDQKISTAKMNRAGCEAAKSQIEQAHARLDATQAALDRLVLRAPFDGIVADISGELGEYATPSPPGIPTLPAIDLIDDQCLFVSAPIDEVDASKVTLGQDARITLEAIKGKQFEGRVQRIAPYVLELEKQARTVEVEVGFARMPQADKLLIGYSADVEIIHDAHANVLRIPTSALMEGKRVLLYGSNGVLESREVVTGLSNWEYTEIVSGLNDGDRIVSSLDRAGVKEGVEAVPESGK
jgi:HlyD family secretion protein